MPHGIDCPNCGRIGFVRVEHVVKGGAASRALYCGSCEYIWTIIDVAAPEPESPKAARRPPMTQHFGPQEN